MKSQRSTGSRLLSYAFVYKYRIVGALAILLCAVGAELGGPFIIKTIIDGHLTPPRSGDIDSVLGLLGLYLGLILVSGLLNFSQSYLLQSTALRIIKNIRMDVMRHIQRIPLRYFDNTPAGQIVSRVANDTEAIRELFMSFMATFVVSFAHLLGIYAALFILDARLAVYTLALPPVFAVIMYFHLKFSKKYVSIMRARLSDMNAMINESIAVMPIIQAFRREKATLEEFDRLNEDRYVAQVKQFRVFSLSSRNIVGTIGSLVTAFVIWHFGSLSLSGAALSFGVLYAFIDYLGRIFNPIIGIFDQLMNAQRAFVSADKVFAILDMEGREVEDASEAVRPKGEVKFENVTFAYNGEDHVLKNISFEARQGETVALVGHTGSGKSSILNLLLGFYEPSSGKITIDGVDISALSKQELRKHMGIVLQDPYLFAGDIKFNVSLYNPEISLDQVKRALADVGASSFVEQLPSGYDEQVVERGSTLSSGQRQLISFARALAFNPSILILDEATASIDSETEGMIQRALKVVSEGRTTLVIAHRLSTIRDASQILVLHRGEIVERGTHDELMALRGRYFKMYQLQTGEKTSLLAKASLGSCRQSSAGGSIS
ncbi:ABC transporter ATP-binding protein [Cohnella hongkongensis]|uniref:ABC transporter ATP-binding protein n=1 Tax=Cohnella hongkongensis TaxID=178337 RepID=A0ABV9F9B6_9BACL